MKKKLLAAVLAATMVASTGCVVMAADGDTDYDVENREYKDVTITLHTRWDAADITGKLYENIVNDFYGEISGN